ncbi:MAG: HipA domain-containing protein, partial [Hyphomicrobiales bacterium]|nr:HipA domain-containing protein [Hyphomicrobiales bacterium]
MTRALDVYYNHVLTGTLQQDQDGALIFGYQTDYLAMQDARAISVAMPLREEPYPDRITRSYFSGLLPDERARQRLAAALGVSAGNSFGLLEVIGGECAGALSLLPQGSAIPNTDRQPPEILTQERLAEILELLRTRPLLGGEAGIRLSLAGAQDKLAVCVIDDQIALAKDGRPTTHIVKPFVPGLDASVENELFCMTLAARVGIAAPEVDKGKAGATDFLLVRRYDRIDDTSGVIRRIHQEDFCQALSIPPELKYEDEG